MTATPGRVLAGKYRLEQKLAAGGMGSVWRARHLDLEIDVAVKLIAEELVRTERAKARFQREARAAAQLKSPFVVRIFDYGLDDGTPYLVMELLEGEDLGARLETRRRILLEEAKGLVIQATSGLKAVHDAGLVHRDIKPRNVFLARVGDDEVVRIVDFGIAKNVASRDAVDTSEGVAIGTPAYMSPEQLRGDVVDARSDLWSFAVVLYQLLVGELPQAHDDDGTMSGRMRRPSEVVDDLPPELDPFFAKALTRIPERRFGSAAELASAFLKAAATGDMEGDPVRTTGAAALRGREHETMPVARTRDSATPRPREESRVVPWVVLAGVVVVGGIGARMATSRSEAPRPREEEAAAQAGMVTAVTSAATVTSAAIGVATSEASAMTTPRDAVMPSAAMPSAAPRPLRSTARPASRADAGAKRADAGSAGAVDPVFGLRVDEP